MKNRNDFTQGNILSTLLRFAWPILAAMFLQALYGAVDLLVIGHFGDAAGVSAVATGSQFMQLVTVVTTGLAMGITIAIGQAVGRGSEEDARAAVGNGITVFLIFSAALTVLLLLFTEPVLRLLKTPAEAFAEATAYVRICSCGAVFIVFYNVLASIFRGTGDSRTPLIVVACAAVLNTAGDIYFIGALDMKAAGAALATVISQGVSVGLCVLIIKKKGFRFTPSRKQLRLKKETAGNIMRLGMPIALQDGLVNISFLVIMAIVNSLGVIPSAGVGVAEKVCAFIMLVLSSFAQSLSAFVAQNFGAGRMERAKGSMLAGMKLSLAAGAVLAFLAFFHGGFFSGLFTSDTEVIAASASYLKAYAIDTLMVSFLFCFVGYFNGCGKTKFVMTQGIIGAFGVRIPVSYFVSRVAGVTLFEIGLATPASTVVQIILCFTFFRLLSRKTQKSADRL